MAYSAHQCHGEMLAPEGEPTLAVLGSQEPQCIQKGCSSFIAPEALLIIPEFCLGNALEIGIKAESETFTASEAFLQT